MDDFERTIRQFLAHIDVERGLSKATVSAYGADLKKYRQWLADQGVGGIAAVTTQDVERYIVFLDEFGRVIWKQGTPVGQHSCASSFRSERTYCCR